MPNADLLSRITIDPQICHGKPCVRGLRYPVEFLLELLSGGMTAEQVLTDYPDLEADDLRAEGLMTECGISDGRRILPAHAEVRWRSRPRQTIVD